MTAHFESVYPTLAAIGAAIVAFAFMQVFQIEDARAIALLGSIISAASILAGFAITSLTIVLSLSNTEIMKQLTAKGLHKRLYRFTLRAIYGLLAVVVMSTVTICIPNDKATPIIAAAVVLGAAIGYSCAAFIRVVLPLHALIEEVSSEAKPG